MIEIQRGRVTLPRYPFPTLKTRVLERSDIVEVVDWFPPVIVTTAGEVLLISRTELDELKALCTHQNVPFVQRYDVWSDLLDPFLDTEFSPEFQDANRQRLNQRGNLTDVEIDSIRAEVEEEMLQLSGLAWEWLHYSLADVLSAMKPKTWIGRQKWIAFYVRAMEISMRANNAK